MKKRKLDPKIIRVGDKVKIINPIFFEGCYYDNNLRDKTTEVAKKHGKEIREFIDKMTGISTKLTGLIMLKMDDERDYSEDISIRKIARVIAYDLVHRDMKTGNERKIFTYPLERNKGLICKVEAIKIIKTGFYFPPNNHYDSYNGEYCGEPGGLEKEKTHKILTLHDELMWREYSTSLQIEAKNIEKVYE